MATVHIRQGHVQPLWAGHPWVFAQSIARMEGGPAAGDPVDVVDPKGKFLGRGFWSPQSAIAVRIMSRLAEQPIDAGFLRERIKSAYTWREQGLRLPREGETGYRLINAEGDDMPGLVVDIYGQTAAVQLLTLGMKLRENDIFAAIQEVTRVETILEVPSQRVQEREGFAVERRVVRGNDIDTLRFEERGFGFELDLSTTQKTGYYFDQRETRARVESLAQGRRVLDAFCYVGGFSLGAARGGATSVTAIDSSATAITTGAMLAQRHGLADKIDFVRHDMKRGVPPELGRFDMCIVDPPKLIASPKNVERGRTMYRRLFASALAALEPDGILVACSCSGSFDAGMFLQTLGLSARDANKSLSVFAVGSQSPDHPVPPAFPEGRYLKTAFLKVHR